MNKYEYPFLECDEHPGPQLGIGVCDHVLMGAEVVFFEEPTKEDLGLAMCAECVINFPKVPTDKLSPMCWPHYQENFGVPKGAN